MTCIEIAARIAGVEDFGARLKVVREAKRLDQADLALTDDRIKRRNFGRYVSKIENGKERNPSLKVITKLARGCGYPSLSEFFLHLEGKIVSEAPAVPEVSQPVIAKSDKRTVSNAEVVAESGSHDSVGVSESDIRRVVATTVAETLGKALTAAIGATVPGYVDARTTTDTPTPHRPSGHTTTPVRKRGAHGR